MTINRCKLLRINFGMNTLIYCLETCLCVILVSLEIEACNLIQLLLFAPEWPH